MKRRVLLPPAMLWLRQTRRLVTCLLALGGIWLMTVLVGRAASIEITDPPHDYYRRVPRDPFSKIKARLESGELALDRGSELSFLVSLLGELHIPVSSQSLVFSTTSLQLSLISPSNPRALFFNDDLYIGFIPGGKIEVIGIDPELGGVFYIFERPAESEELKIERSQRCMNCHAGEETRHVPGLVLKSVIPGPGGGSLVAYRVNESGHSVPLEDRFGGWYLTHQGGVTQHWGNLVGRYVEGNLRKEPVVPGKSFSWEKYPVSSSGLLPQLVLEHQAGFVNRATEAAYRTRELVHAKSTGSVTPEALEGELQGLSENLVRYLLFADEAPLPPGGVPTLPEFERDFTARGRKVEGGLLREFDLKTRLFRYRCSYLIQTRLFEGLPEELRSRVVSRIATVLQPGREVKGFGYLSRPEKDSIRKILAQTVPGFAAHR